MPNPNKARELLNLQVSAVALVDEPANKRPFFIVKRKETNPPGDRATSEETDMGKVKKQAQVVAEEAVAGALEGLEQMAEMASQFADSLAGKTPQDGMVILTDEDLTPWREAVALASALEGTLMGGEAPAEEEPMAEAEGVDEEARMAKDAEGATDDPPEWQVKADERLGVLEEAVGEILGLLRGALGSDEEVTGAPNGADLTSEGLTAESEAL